MLRIEAVWFGMDEVTSRRMIGAAIEVHRFLGPGLLESAYQTCLAHELGLRGLQFAHHVDLPVVFKGVTLGCGYRMDFVVEGQLVVEVKAISTIHPVHQAQLLTCLKLGGYRVGLLLNFHAALMKDGILRAVL